MAEVASRMFSTLLNLRSLTHKEATPLAEIAEEEEVHPRHELEGDIPQKDQLDNQILSPRGIVEPIRKSSTPLLSRRGSPIPSSLQDGGRNQIRGELFDDTNEFLKRTTPVVEFIEFHNEQMKSKKKKGKTHRRRNSEPIAYNRSVREKTMRSHRASTEGLNPTVQAMTRNLAPATMGKSPSLRDIFSLKKVTSTGGFSKPGQFLEHLRTHVPSLQELQRLQHILESKQWSFIQRFTDKGGAMALFSILSVFSKKKQTTTEDINICNVCCGCIFALLVASEENEELSVKMAYAVKSMVATEMPHTDNMVSCANQIANLTTICENSYGHRFVLHEMKQRRDFPVLVNLLQTDLSVEGDTHTENLRIKVAVLALINKLLEGIGDLQERFKVINNFLELKLFPILMDLRRSEAPELIHTISGFEEYISKTYFALLPKAKRNDHSNELDFLAVNIPVFNITQASVSVPYEPAKAIVNDVVSYAYKQVSYLLQFDEKSYGIFLVEKECSSSESSPREEAVSPEPTPTPSPSLIASIRSSREDMSDVSLRASHEVVDTEEEDDSEVSKSKSPRQDRLTKRRASHHKTPSQEIVVINPLYGKENPMLKHSRTRSLAAYTKKSVITLAACDLDDDEDEYATEETKGQWLTGSEQVSVTRQEGWEMKLKPWDLNITWRKQTIPVRVEPDTTTFSDVIEKVLNALKKQDEDRIFEYNLIVHKTKSDDSTEAVWLEPLKYVCSLPPKVRDLELRTRPIPLCIRSKDTTTHSVMVNDTTTLQQVIKEFGGKLGLQGRHLQDYGLYDSITEEWLETGDILPILQRDNVDLHFLLRPCTIRVVYQVADCDLPRIETRKERSASTSYSNIPLYESPSQSHPLLMTTSPVTTQELPMEPHSFKSEDLLVHFTLCVSQVQAAVCKELGIDPDEYSMYKETPDASVVELTPWKSLRNQGVLPRSCVLLLRNSERGETGNDVDVWDEPTTDSNLLYEDSTKKQVAAGTLNQLVKVLTSETDHDIFFLETFMLTYRSFTDHKTLLRKLGERYTTPFNIDESVAKTIKAHVGIVLKYWITHEDPAEKDAILDEIAKFVDSFAEDFSDLATRLEKCIQSERNRLNSPREEVVYPVDESQRLSPGLFSLNLLDLDEYTIACQLALQDSERYSKLKIAEFFNQAWLKNKAPNLMAMVAHFNSISSAVATAIVTERLIKKRVKILEKFILVASYLRKLNDFYSLQALICAFNSSAVNRLKFTMERISSQSAQILTELEELMSMENSYKNYRQALHSAKPPCVPHIGVYMTDLTFIDEGNPDNYGHLINFSKRTLVSKTLLEIESHREAKYNLQSSKRIEQFINHLPRMPENDLYHASLECEPRGAAKSSLK